VMIQITVNQAISSAEQRLSVPIVGIETAPNLEAFLAADGIDADREHGIADLDSAARAVTDGAHRLVVVIEDSFAENLGSDRAARVTVVFDRSDSRSAERVQRVQNRLRAWSERIGTLRLLARGVSPAVARPILVDSYDISTPTGRSALVLGVLTFFLLFAVLMGGLYLAIDTTAGERERKSLEPLLTIPVPRTSLLLGKVSATVLFMLASLLLTLIGLGIAMPYLPLGELGMSSGFTALAAAYTFLLLVPFSVLGAFLMTLVASFTKSYREAQTWLGLLLLVPTLPVAIATILNLEPSQPLMWVPSMSQHLLITTLIKQESIAPLMVVQSAASTLIYAMLAALVTIRLYKREALLG
jgi:sodium transport system permease protein